MQNHCIVLFSKCNYKGKHLEVCDDIPNLMKPHNFHVTKSLFIPSTFKRLPVYLNELKNYKGSHHKFNHSNKCLNIKNNKHKSLFFVKKSSSIN